MLVMPEKSINSVVTTVSVDAVNDPLAIIRFWLERRARADEKDSDNNRTRVQHATRTRNVPEFIDYNAEDRA